MRRRELFVLGNAALALGLLTVGVGAMWGLDATVDIRVETTHTVRPPHGAHTLQKINENVTSEFKGGASDVSSQRTTRQMKRTMKGGRDGPDDSHAGMAPDPVDHMYHAWQPADTHKCLGTANDPSCESPSAAEWFKSNMLLAIISGREGAFRVEVSHCTWLRHLAPENVFVFSDVVPDETRNFTPYTWVPMVLPPGVSVTDDGDYVSKYIPNGYVQQVRASGQGYSAAWIGAQFRFFQALTHMSNISISRGIGGAHAHKWFMIADDDTMVNINHLSDRLQHSSFTSAKGLSTPWYLSKKGWGGAGHIYNAEAMRRMIGVIDVCTERYLVKGFRASDAALLKCSGVAKLHAHKEDTMSHCPASHLGEGVMASPTQTTFHLKKDFYPPVALVSWKLMLYYRASYCHDRRAAKLAVEFSTCAFGNCKRAGCTKEKNAKLAEEWRALYPNSSIPTLPLWKLNSL